MGFCKGPYLTASMGPSNPVRMGSHGGRGHGPLGVHASQPGRAAPRPTHAAEGGQKTQIATGRRRGVIRTSRLAIKWPTMR